MCISADGGDTSTSIAVNCSGNWRTEAEAATKAASVICGGEYIVVQSAQWYEVHCGLGALVGKGPDVSCGGVMVEWGEGMERDSNLVLNQTDLFWGWCRDTITCSNKAGMAGARYGWWRNLR